MSDSEQYTPYGNPWGGDGLFNMRIGDYGIEGAFRFLVRETTEVNKLRYFNTYSFKKPGYHAGTGGKIRIELRDDDGSDDHLPLNKPLAAALVPDPLKSPSQLLVEFDRTVILNAGHYYHLVFTNYDDDPQHNHVSIDMLATLAKRRFPSPDEPEQPASAPFDMTTLIRDRTNRRWRLFKPNLTVTPIFTLYHSPSPQHPDRIAVPGYGGMESWEAFPRRIVGHHQVRQVFTPDRDIPVKNVAVRLARDGNPGPLTATLKTADETLAVTSLPAEKISPIDPTILRGARLGHTWVTLPFDPPVTLKAGTQHWLELSATPAQNPDDACEIYPLRDGSDFGYASPWPNAWAEFTSSLTPHWTGWEAWEKPNLKDADLQLYFNAGH